MLERWRSTAFLADASLNARGWLLAVMRAVEAIGRPEFTLDEVYAHKAALAATRFSQSSVPPRAMGTRCSRVKLDGVYLEGSITHVQ
ncbi:MAG TPA: hypothetical protein PLE81_09375 [Brevundimonas sp.]|uniref:hypothetical protein n=1 Tax=Brevundimonas sp. TaxID=1871086 RepID=UPI002B70F8AC|nr:hypothetical protein [Brevundimonas sp.]HRH20832.1 hypothetical protein [Brevundimonas sp.]